MDGDLISGGVQNRGHDKMEGSMLHGTPYIFYQLELSMLLSDCFCMSFQSRAVFCSSQVIRGFPCQDIMSWTLEFEFRVYHST